MDTVQKLFRFLDESPTCYHAAANAKAALTAAGAVELRESEQWKLEKGTLYVVERGDSALVAFRVPEGPFHGFLMAAAHSDSPTFKVRETAEAASAGNPLRLSVEPYGGGVWRGWLDRPLSVAGRVVIRQGDRLVSRLVNIDRDLLVIPGVAIHMDRSVNKGAELNPAVDLLPLLGCGKEPGAFRKLIAEAAGGVREEHLLSTELFLYPRTKAVQTGLNGEFIVSPRLDDLQCVFGCLEGFLSAKPGGSLPVLAVFNNEEVGSNTRQGADSTFLTDVLERIAHGCGLDSEGWKAAAANSFMVSADNAHAIHTAHPEYARCWAAASSSSTTPTSATPRTPYPGRCFRPSVRRRGCRSSDTATGRISPAAPPWAISPQPISPSPPWTSACPNWPCTASARRRGRRIRTIW